MTALRASAARRWLWLPVLLAALLALYALVGFLALPALARRELTAYVQRAPGAHLTLGALTFNPFTLTAQARAVAVSGADGVAPLAFGHLLITASASSLWERAWVFNRIEIDEPLVDLRIARDGSVNLARLLAALNASGSAATAPRRGVASGAGTYPRVRIGALLVHDGSTHFQDLSRAAPFAITLKPIEITLDDFRTQPAFDSPYRISARATDGAQLAWSGTLSVQPLGSTGQFSVDGVSIPTLAAYMQGELPLALRGGTLALLGDYRFHADAPRVLTVNLRTVSIRGLLAAPASAVSSDAAPVVLSSVVPPLPWISLPQIDLAGASMDLVAQRIDIRQISLHAPSLTVDRSADGSLQPLSALSSSGQPASAAGPSAAGPGTAGESTAGPITAGSSAGGSQPWTLALGRLSVDGGNLQLIDESVQPAVRLHVAPLAINVSNYTSSGGTPLMLDLAAGLDHGGSLHAAGSVALTPLSGTLQLALQRFDLTTLQPYVAQQTAATLYRGNLAIQSTVQFGGASQLQVSGSITASNFAARDNVSGADFLTGRALQISGLKYQQSPAALRIGEILARGVFGRVIVGANGTLNVTQILRPRQAGGAGGAPHAPATAGASASAGVRPAAVRTVRASTVGSGSIAGTGSTSGAPLGPGASPISIGRVDIRGGAADFTDHSVQPNFSAAIVGLRGSVVGLSSDPRSRAQLQLQGSVNQYSPVTIAGQVNLLSASTYTDLAMTFSNIDLTIFNPYSGRFAGYSIAQGKLTTQMHYLVENRRLQATHHIEIDQLEFGPATAARPAVPLPIKLAAALLKDRRGVISLDLPVGGSLDDPTFRYGPIVWKLFTGLVRKIVTAPFALLGSLFGGGGPQLAYVDFAAGSADLAAAQAQKLVQLAHALAQRPQLKLDIPLHTLSVADDQALAHTALEQAIQQLVQQDSSTDGSVSSTATRRSARGRQMRGAASDAKRAGRSAAGAAPPESPRLLALEGLYGQKFHAIPGYPADVTDEQARGSWLEQQLLPRFGPSQQQRDALARARADAAEAAVLTDHDVAPMRVFLTNTTSGGGAADAVRMQLQLE